MVLAISDVKQAIVDAIEQALGPLANLKIEGSDVRDILIQLISTIVLFVVVRVFLWKPITNILETRREAMDKALEEANQSKEASIALELELQKEMNDAKVKVKEMMAKAELDANQRREEIIQDAKIEAKRRLENLELELEQEKKNMEKDIKQEIVDIAFKAAEKIVAKEIDQEKYLVVVDEILKGANES